MQILIDVSLVLLGYLIGSIPSGLIIVKLKTGKDIRKVESGRTGGTNAMRAAGFWAGLLTAFLDVLKATVAVWLAQYFSPGNNWVHILAPIGAILGHNYSLYLPEYDENGRFVRFRGGAGGAPALGGAIGLWPPSVFIILPLAAPALALLCVLWQPVDATPLILTGPLYLLLRAISLLALLSFVWAFISIEGFDAFGTGDVLARFRHRSRHPVPLAVNGPYRWVRHPFYFLVVVMLWASPVISGDRLLLNALFTIWIVLGARWEERDLIVQYGDAYRRYQEEVPMLVPRRFPLRARSVIFR